MQYLVHYPSYNLPPVGVWWLDAAGQPQSYYQPGTDDMQVMAMARLGAVQGQVPWDNVVDALSNRLPRADGWEELDTDDSVSPQQALRLIQRAVPA